jgi:hypothetical protein
MQRWALSLEDVAGIHTRVAGILLFHSIWVPKMGGRIINPKSIQEYLNVSLEGRKCTVTHCVS